MAATPSSVLQLGLNSGDPNLLLTLGFGSAVVVSVYISPSYLACDQVVTTAEWNQTIVANEQAMAPAIFTGAGDIEVATGVDAGTRLGIGTVGQILLVNSGVEQWSNHPDDPLCYYGFYMPTQEVTSVGDV